MASLRARLIAALLAVAAVGLLVLGGVTYAEQRSFLLTRVDAAARNAFGPVDFARGTRVLATASHRPRPTITAATAPARTRTCRPARTGSAATRTAR